MTVGHPKLFTGWPMPSPARKPPRKRPEGAVPAYCPGRSAKEPCKEGPVDEITQRPTAASLGITVDQAAAAEANTGTPPRCFKCSENRPVKEVSP